MYEWVLATLDASRESRPPWHRALLGQAARRRDARQDAVELQPGQHDRRERAARAPRRRLASRVPRPRRGDRPQGSGALWPRRVRASARPRSTRSTSATFCCSTRRRATPHCVPRSSRRFVATPTARGTSGAIAATCFHFSSGGVTLLNQSAMVQLLALLAWDPRAYGRLA